MATWYYTEFKRKLEENFCLRHVNEPDFHEKWITLQSNSQTLAHQWLDAFPNEGLGQTITSTMFDTMLKVRLLIPVVRPGRCGNCDMAITSVSHVYLCGGRNNNRYARHEIVSEGLV
jgi:hypothetical protein